MTKDIGKFIQEVRKEKGLTQKELADLICVSDKTISKWENGNSAPDVSMLMSLCDSLDVTANELLAGERIPPENYSMKAEETIMTLMKENEVGKKKNIISMILGAVLIVIAILLMSITSQSGHSGLSFITYFIDGASFIFIVITAVGVVLVSGIREKMTILGLLSKIIIPIGVVISIVSAVIMLCMLDDISKIGPSLCVVMLSIFYSCIAKIVVEVLIAKRSK